MMTLVAAAASSASSARRFASAMVPDARTSALSRNTRARMSSRSLRDTVSCAHDPGSSEVMTGGVEPSHVRGPPDGVEIIPRLEEKGATRRVGGRARRGEEDDAGAVVPAGLASASMFG